MSTDNMSKEPKYRIEADSFTGLVAKVVYLLRLESPSIVKFQCTCNDGSKVTIAAHAKNPPEARCRSGIEIDGARLG